MDEYIHLIGGFLGHVYKYDPVKRVQMFQGLSMYGSSSCIGQIRQISQFSQKEFRKT